MLNSSIAYCDNPICRQGSAREALAPKPQEAGEGPLRGLWFRLAISWRIRTFAGPRVQAVPKLEPSGRSKCRKQSFRVKVLTRVNGVYRGSHEGERHICSSARMPLCTAWGKPWLANRLQGRTIGSWLLRSLVLTRLCRMVV